MRRREGGEGEAGLSSGGACARGRQQVSQAMQRGDAATATRHMRSRTCSRRTRLLEAKGPIRPLPSPLPSSRLRPCFVRLLAHLPAPPQLRRAAPASRSPRAAPCAARTLFFFRRRYEKKRSQKLFRIAPRRAAPSPAIGKAWYRGAGPGRAPAPRRAPPPKKKLFCRISLPKKQRTSAPQASRRGPWRRSVAPPRGAGARLAIPRRLAPKRTRPTTPRPAPPRMAAAGLSWDRSMGARARARPRARARRAPPMQGTTRAGARGPLFFFFPPRRFCVRARARRTSIRISLSLRCDLPPASIPVRSVRAPADAFAFAFAPPRNFSPRRIGRNPLSRGFRMGSFRRFPRARRISPFAAAPRHAGPRGPNPTQTRIRRAPRRRRSKCEGRSADCETLETA